MKIQSLRMLFVAALLIAGCHDRADLSQTTLPSLGEGERDRLGLPLPQPAEGDEVEADELGAPRAPDIIRVPPGGIVESDIPGSLEGIVVAPGEEGEAPGGGEEKVLEPDEAEKDLGILVRKKIQPDAPCAGGAPLEFRQNGSVRQNDLEIDKNIFGGEPVDILLNSEISVSLELSGGFGGPYQWEVERVNRNRQTTSNWNISYSSSDGWILSINRLRYRESLPADDFLEELDITYTDETCPHLAGTRRARFNVVRPRDKLKNLWAALEFHRYTADYISDADSGSYALVKFYINRDVAAHVYYDLYRCQGDIGRCTKPKKITLGDRHTSGFGLPTEEEEAFGELYLDQLTEIRINFYDSDTGRWTPGNQEMDVHLDKIILFSPFWKAEYSDYTSPSGHNHRLFGADIVSYTSPYAMRFLPPNTWENAGDFLRDIWHPLTRPYYSGRTLETRVQECSEGWFCQWNNFWE